jgi:hypothetical protein
VPSKLTAEAGLASGWSAGPSKNSAFKLEPLPDTRIVMGICCESWMVVYPCQIPVSGKREEDWARLAEGANVADMRPKSLHRSFVIDRVDRPSEN